MESLSTDLSAQIAMLASEVNIKIDSINEDLARHDTRLNCLEDGANIYTDKVVTLEEQVIRLSSDVVKLTSKDEDLENRQRIDTVEVRSLHTLRLESLTSFSTTPQMSS